MSITATVRDYRGIERATIALAPLALIAGANEQGKSCLAEAVRAGLTSTPLPIEGIAKKDAALFVRDGAERGSIQVSSGDTLSIVSWPNCDAVRNTGDDGRDELRCSPFAVGLAHPFDMDQKERALALGKYLQSTPTLEDLTTACADAGYSEAAIAKIWESVTAAGGHDPWGATLKRTREHATNLKGQWEQVTGEKYGTKKAEDWRAAGLPDEPDRAVLEAAVKAAQAAVTEVAGQTAVTAAEIERLRTESMADSEANVDGLLADLEKLKSDLEASEQERAELPAEPNESNLIACPACEARLVVVQPHRGPVSLQQFDEAAAKKAKTKAMQKKRAAADGKVERLKGQIGTLSRTIDDQRVLVANAERARARLAEVEDQPQTDATAVEAARANETAAIAALNAFHATATAAKLHADISRTLRLVDILVPEGLRRRKMTDGLKGFNTKLAGMAITARWPQVRMDEDLEFHYGDRPVWAASKSGRWRARLMVQLALASIDESAAVVIDEADILDADGRNQLFGLLMSSGTIGLICMTLPPDKVPDLKKAGIGQSYWVENGIVREL